MLSTGDKYDYDTYNYDYDSDAYDSGDEVCLVNGNKKIPKNRPFLTKVTVEDLKSCIKDDTKPKTMIDIVSNTLKIVEDIKNKIK